MIRYPAAVVRRHPFLAAAFALALALTVAFGARTFVRAIYWSAHHQDPIAAWMPIGYVAQAYDVPPDVLLEAVGLPAGARDRRPIAEIAATTGRSDEDVIRLLEAAIEAARHPPVVEEDPS
jgi:hypothetical protein